MCRVGRRSSSPLSNCSTKKSVAALTARQYRETKKMEFERLKSQLEMFKDAYYHYKQLYEKSQLELKALTERCFMLEQRSLRNSFPMPSDPTFCCGPICLSPSESCDLSLAFDSDLTYESWEDPVLASLH
ncbi:unnamed protein product [Hydatigera taeniaeformis]|uniref:Akirin n=1 Tax=Hydatigena taeniaeformis TaxID=6205 RepID=A0A0R3XAN0_HYDTA|nr:unnamed protein product [Hydatigera taeniaeformis]